MMSEHGEAHTQAAYNQGHVPTVNEDLARTFRLAERAGTELSQEELRSYGGGFPSDGWRFQGYDFVITFGQGTMFQVYKDEERILALG